MTPLEKLVALVRRELSADDVTIAEPGHEPAEGTLAADLPGDRRLIVTFGGPISDLDARRRRLEILVDSFAETLRSPATSRPPPAQSLHSELQALAGRAGAVDALVIDARSPVVWGAAEDDDAAPHLMPTDNIIDLEARRSGERPSTTIKVERSASLRAVEAVRALPTIPALHRGAHLHESAREADLGWIARSFAGIYVLVLVFEGTFDELGAERAITHALPIVERLVTALPPLDPTPVAGVAAIRRPRRR
jgi:hypothetical protein